MSENVAQVASRMYGISLVRSRLLIEQLLRERSDLDERELLKLIGEKSLFYLTSLK